ncbi:MAG: DUF393 domain-containing protein [Blastochloris sp.]|nr:DUF393 domain-containing protein [Blastochloris sp.]
MTLLYDASCGICRESRTWLETQNTWIQLEFLALQSPDLSIRFPGIEKYRPMEQLLVVGEGGELYQGADAWIMVLYALVEYRELSLKLAHPILKPFARKAYEAVARNRHVLSAFLGKSEGDEEALKTVLENQDSARWLCQCDGECHVLRPGEAGRNRRAA